MPGHSPPSHTVPTTTNRNANASDTALMSPRCGCNTTTSAAVATTATTQPATVFLMSSPLWGAGPRPSLGGELEAWVDHAALAALFAQDALDHDPGAEREPTDATAAHEDDDRFAGAVGDERLERLVAAHRQDRDALDDAGHLHLGAVRRLGDQHGAGHRIGPVADLCGQARLVALGQSIEPATKRAHAPDALGSSASRPLDVRLGGVGRGDVLAELGLTGLRHPDRHRQHHRDHDAD